MVLQSVDLFTALFFLIFGVYETHIVLGKLYSSVFSFTVVIYMYYHLCTCIGFLEIINPFLV